MQRDQERLLQLLIPGMAQANNDASRGTERSPVRSARARTRPDSAPHNWREEADALVDKLAVSGLPFVEARLGGGPWTVLYTTGNLQLWRAVANVAASLPRPGGAGARAVAGAERGRGGNRVVASQEFGPETRAAVNRVDYSGDIWVTASGCYEPMVTLGQGGARAGCVSESQTTGVQPAPASPVLVALFLPRDAEINPAFVCESTGWTDTPPAP